jgi:hypothetical protein
MAARFHHERRLTRTLCAGLCMLALIAALVVGELLYASPRDPGYGFARVAFHLLCILMVLVAVIVVFRAWQNRHRPFRVVLENGRLDYSDPLSSAPASFNVTVEDITLVEVRADSDGPDRYTLNLADGRHRDLSSAHRLNREALVAALAAANPSLIIKRP